MKAKESLIFFKMKDYYNIEKPKQEIVIPSPTVAVELKMTIKKFYWDIKLLHQYHFSSDTCFACC